MTPTAVAASTNRLSPCGSWPDRTMRSEQRGQMPGNRATTQQDTLVRNLQNSASNFNRPTPLTARARTPVDKPRSFTDAARQSLGPRRTGHSGVVADEVEVLRGGVAN